jgi:hypothetical protein
VVVYAQHYRLNLWSDFTYFLDDPVNGDQFEQAEDRWIYGGSGSRAIRPWGPDWSVTVVAETRFDDIDSIGLYHTRARQRLTADRQDKVQELSGALWSDANWHLGPGGSARL